MMILDTKVPDKIKLALTIPEMLFMYEWMHGYFHMNGMIQMSVLNNGCDMIDYRTVEIEFNTKYGNHNEISGYKDETLKFIRSLSQESNFGGIRENDYLRYHPQAL